MTVGFTKFPSISAFSHAHRNMMRNMPIDETIVLGAKIKLHGTNGGVRIDPNDGTLTAQSRNRDLQVGEDNAGFAAFVKGQRDTWLSVMSHAGLAKEKIVFFGEWAGPGIQQNDAVTKIPEREFFIFALQLDEMMITSPQAIRDVLPKGLSQVRVLDWLGSDYPLKPSSADNVENLVEQCNAACERIGECDPFIADNYGIEGVGEGFVSMPVSITTVERFGMFSFKVKSEAHRVNKSKKAATTTFMVPETVKDFLDTFLTEQRLMQGVSEVNDGLFDKTKTQDFLKWVGNDVRKESRVELEKSGFEWKQVAKHVNQTAVTWWIGKCDAPKAEGAAA